MKTAKTKVLFFLGIVVLLVGFSSCSSESTIPTARHAEPVHSETHWN